MTKQVPEGYISGEMINNDFSWHKLELNNVLTIVSSKFNPSISAEKLKCIELEHITQETGRLLGFVNSSEQLSIKNRFKAGQVLFGKLRPYLKKYWLANFDGVCSTEIWVLSGNAVINQYLYYLIQTSKFNQAANISTGSKMPRSDWQYMSEVPFSIPINKKEQEKIVEILSTWDDAIAKQEELIEQKQQFKKSIMQQIFSQKLRFKDDDGSEYPAWEEKKLGDVSIITTGSSNREDSTLDSGRYTFFDRSQDVRTSDIYLFDCEAIIVAGEGQEFIPKYYSGKFDLHQRTYAIMSFTNVLGRFLYYLIYFYKSYFLSQAVGSTVKSLRLPMFQKMQIRIPSIIEQQKIADFLTAIDDEITKQNEVLAELKTQKKSLMQKLLTGEVRVKI